MMRGTLLRRLLAAAAAAASASSSSAAATVGRGASSSFSRFAPHLAFAARASRSAATPDVGGGDFVFVEPLPPPPPPSSAATMPTLLQPRVVIYDGVCHLCHRGVRWVIKADKYEKIRFCCLQSKAAEPYLRLCGVDREDVLRRFLFIEGPEAYYEGSAAALKVASYLPFPYSALSSLMIIPAPLRDAVYDYVAKHRYEWFGKEDKCIVMKDTDLLERFIDRDEMLGDGDEGGGNDGIGRFL
ncbi:uncharacterized protein LOC109706541 [Ananas comosus]|uniref:Uncharacterized protein LOC109706204 n=1 Tax=Ananas comosus TaxID=4615 RepID=A0A6P5EHV2_ANACO|nr:uncharacterized protein LOC109706204 [Ananas comosus]XP_020083046.1 uncharacterized protein LOC109706541 [Ananas comosus]